MSNFLVQLVYEDNQSAHNDLIFRLGDYEHRGDSYYLGLDPTISPDDESPDKVRHVLSCLLEQWLACIETTIDGESIFLPYDFSDESTCWLRCDFHEGMVTLQPGWSDKEGWSLKPCLILSHTRLVNDFEPIADGPTIRVARSLFELDVNASLQAARREISPDQSHLHLPAVDAEEVSLTGLEIGQRGVIVRIEGDQSMLDACNRLGLVDGVSVTLLRFGPDTEVLELQRGEEMISIAADLAAGIDIRLTP